MDTKGVRRDTAPTVRPYRRGTFTGALQIAGSATKLAEARKRLRGRIYANSSRKPRKRKLRTVRRLCKAMGTKLLPITPDKAEGVMASLTESNHRTAMAYFSIWKKEHIRRGHKWTEQLEEQRLDLSRAATRGLGPTKKAEAFVAEARPNQPNTAVEPLTKRGPMFPHLLADVGTCWLMRGAELAALLGEQASISEQKREATVDLCATKMDPGGRGCKRTLGCICGQVLGPCPFCGIRELLALRQERGLGPKDPLFPTTKGRAPKPKAVTATLRKVLQDELATEHSMRRAGAQMYARRGLLLFLIQFLGRWGGSTILRYTEEAFEQQLAQASTARAARPSDLPTSWATLRAEIQKIVDSSTRLA